MKKNVYKSILWGAFIAVIAIIASSCKDEGDNGGAPYISYIRISNPQSADSLLVAAGQGQLIAIVGGNLQNTREVWFNDQQSRLTPTYISKTTVFATVPSEIPTVVTNKLKLVFANGDSLLYDFEVTINKPVIDGANKLKPYGMSCEYVPDGEIATIYGQYFYLPITVTFPGGVTASSENGDVFVNEANTILLVKVPEGAQPGQLIVTSNFGSQISDFWFRDNRNIFQGFEGDPSKPDDPFWNLGTNANPGIVTNPGAGDPPLINANYIRIVFNGQTWWTQLFVDWSTPGFAIPDEAILHPSQYYFKFEVCTTQPYNACGVNIWVTDMATRNIEEHNYSWPPSLDTHGTWQTVVIPFEDIASAEGSYFPSVQPDGYFCAFIFAGADPINCDMSFDNFRIVPKSLPKPAGSDY